MLVYKIKCLTLQCFNKQVKQVEIMKAIVVKESTFDVVNIVMSSKGVPVPCPAILVFVDDVVYIKYLKFADLPKASAILFSLGIHHRCVVKYNLSALW